MAYCVLFVMSGARSFYVVNWSEQRERVMIKDRDTATYVGRTMTGRPDRGRRVPYIPCLLFKDQPFWVMLDGVAIVATSRSDLSLYNERSKREQTQ